MLNRRRMLNKGKGDEGKGDVKGKGDMALVVVFAHVVVT